MGRTTKTNKRRGELGAKVLGACGLPPESGCTLPFIAVTGKSCAKVENHRGVLQLSSCCVRLYSSIGIIRIEGNGLVVSDMDNEQIGIKGAISSFKFE